MTQSDFDFLSDVVEEEENVTTEREVDCEPQVHFSSSENMEDVDDESVHLIVTSPPYNTDWEYGGTDDDLDYATEYIPMLARVFKECYRVLVPGGRLVVNVPSLLRDGSEGGFPIASHIEAMMNTRACPFLFRYDSDDDKSVAELRSNCDWKTREVIQWVKGFNTDGLAPNGSYPRPWGILMNNVHETLTVYQKPGERDVSTIPDSIVEDSEINKRNDDLCDDVWQISPESWDFDNQDQNVPVFPEEIPKRCIRLWTYKGDTVLDPFGGRGTTCKAAKDLKRESIMYEKRESVKEEIYEYIGKDQLTIDQW